MEDIVSREAAEGAISLWKDERDRLATELTRCVVDRDRLAARVRVLEDIADLAKEMLTEARLTPDGLIIREKLDKSDAHYRLCKLLWPKTPREAALSAVAAPVKGE